MTEPSGGAGAPEERRQYERVPARIQVRFAHPAHAARAFRAYSLNFSVGGLCLKTQRTYAVGDPLTLELEVGGHDFKLMGSVAWVRPGVIGVRFEDVSEGDRERLAQIVETFKG
jgi:uncharacterized protein (TIGR02266 family)